MSYSTYLCVTMATLLLGTPAHTDEPAAATPDLDDVLQPVLQKLQDLVERFRHCPVSPLVTADFEAELQQAARELARVATQWTYNHLEADAVPALPRQVHFESSPY